MPMVRKELEGMSDFDLSTLCKDFQRRGLAHLMLEEEVIFDSGKFRTLQELLPRLISEGHRMLLFRWGAGLCVRGKVQRLPAALAASL